MDAHPLPVALSGQSHPAPHRLVFPTMAHELGTFFRRLRHVLASPATEGVSDGSLLERYRSRRDESAFAALLERHGPMVLGVCRRLLKNGPDADDAFQATFLVLLRKAGSIARRESVGSWLYGVAYRIALRAKATANRHQARERQVEPMADSGSYDPEVRSILDEELEGMPDKFRQPVIL